MHINNNNVFYLTQQHLQQLETVFVYFTVALAPRLVFLSPSNSSVILVARACRYPRASFSSLTLQQTRKNTRLHYYTGKLNAIKYSKEPISHITINIKDVIAVLCSTFTFRKTPCLQSQSQWCNCDWESHRVFLFLLVIHQEKKQRTHRQTQTTSDTHAVFR